MWIGIAGAVVGVTVAIIAAVSPETLFGFMTGGRSIKSMMPKPEVSGEFTASGGALGQWTFKPDKCSSGERDGFFGVWLTKKGDKDHWVKVAKNPATGQFVVTVRIPGTDKGQVFKKCKVLDGSVVRTNTRVNRIWALNGNVKIDCPQKFKGTATFKMCH
jgi:hypothetical protein